MGGYRGHGKRICCVIVAEAPQEPVGAVWELLDFEGRVCLPEPLLLSHRFIPEGEIA